MSNSIIGNDENKEKKKSARNRRRTYIINIILPALVFGTISGFITALVVIIYKKCAGFLIGKSEVFYEFMREHLFVAPLFAIGLFGVAFLFSLVYKNNRNLRGGGIPTTVGFLRGIFDFNWVKNLFSVFGLSLVSFFVGTPLGNEGPSVQMGASVGKGTVDVISRKHKAWERYSMTGGACAGFTCATGAPVSGIMFAIEDAHRRITPMILMVSFSSVVTAYFTSLILSPIFKVSPNLFSGISSATLDFKHFWLPILVGAVMGIISVVILKYYKFLSRFFAKFLVKAPPYVKIFLCFFLTVMFGLISMSFISTGHHLTQELFVKHSPVWFLLLVLLVRCSLTLSASSCGITGGLFLPIISLGAVSASIVGEISMALGLSPEYYSLILIMGIASVIAGVMKTPLTAIVFAVESLFCFNNILPVICSVAITYAICEIFDVKSITDAVLEHRIRCLKREKPSRVVEVKVKIQHGAFVVGKQIRDILWPYNCFVLSSKRAHKNEKVMDETGDRSMKEGDTLYIRMASFDEEHSIEELKYLVGKQEITPVEVDLTKQGVH